MNTQKEYNNVKINNTYFIPTATTSRKDIEKAVEEVEQLSNFDISKFIHITQVD